MRIKPTRSLAALLLLVSVPSWSAPASILETLNASGVFAGVSAIAVPEAPPTQAPSASAAPAQPDWAFTPGKLCVSGDPDFKEIRYSEQIAYCNRHVTREMKVQVAAHYGIPQSEWVNYEFDHLLPLAIGGNSRVENLWPQPRGQTESDGKDKLELDLYLKMKAGTITQAEAIRQTYDWFKQNMPGVALAAARPY